MHRNHPPSDNEHPGRPAAADTPATAGSAPAAAGLARRRQLEKSVSWSGRERLRCLWYRLRLTVAEMNYAAWRIADPRVVELQAPPAPIYHPSR